LGSFSLFLGQEFVTVNNDLLRSNLTDIQLQQIVDKTILEGDDDKDGKISFEEFKKVLSPPYFSVRG